MAIKTTWMVDRMVHVKSDGGVVSVAWSLTAQSDAGGNEVARAGNKQKLTYDPSSKDFIAYKDLKESDVLGWIQEANKGPITGGPENETAAEYKARIESERTAKVQSQIDKAKQSDELPW